jgi:hypothetical protein
MILGRYRVRQWLLLIAAQASPIDPQAGDAQKSRDP